MSELIQIFMERDGMSRSEAKELLEDMRSEVADGADPEDVLYENGLEPDYIFELI